MAEMADPVLFQPFLRFWLQEVRRRTMKTLKPSVSTLLEILESFPLFDIVDVYGMFQPFLRFWRGFLRWL